MSSPPSFKHVLDVIRDAPPLDPPAARLVCLGAVEMPEVGDYRFEPVIITPTRFLGRRLWFVPLALLILAMWLASVFHLIPLKSSINLGSFSYFLVMGFGMAGAWIWRTTIRPTYIRLAPGVVQIVEFFWGKRKPNIRSFPMQPGTVVIVHQAAGARRPTAIWLSRDGRTEQIPLAQMQRSGEAADQLWRAVLSSAPTPPLSEEELLG
jgi:hypothetical protein